MSATMKFSVQAQPFAQALAETLEMITGEPVAFVLIIQIDKVAQYVANCNRLEGTELIESLLARWKANRADIPAHYNPDLPKP
jgi:hypothetical protein